MVTVAASHGRGGGHMVMSGSDKMIPSGSAMSGTDIMVHATNVDLAYMCDQFDFPTFALDHQFACDNACAVQAFIVDQYPNLPCLIGSVAELAEDKVRNILRRDKWHTISEVEHFGAGFVCISRTKQSSKRSQNKGCVRNQQEATGVNYYQTASVVRKKRAFIPFLENLDELNEEYEDATTGDLTIDVDYIVEDFAKPDLTAQLVRRITKKNQHKHYKKITGRSAAW